MNSIQDYKHSVVERFLKYVVIDTQSDPHSKTSPSTEKQRTLGKLLVEELLQMGITDVSQDSYGYIYATIESNTKKTVPIICFCSHMDTSPDCSGTNVKPIIHSKYNGENIILPDDTNQVIRMVDHPDLKTQIGNDIITASGTTLLGADNKAGIAEIMDAAYYLINHPEVKHGDIRILFTPDEEIGRGVDHVDLSRLGADYAYTVDGESLGTIENETFSADGATINIVGVSTHPGFAKGKMESALKIAAEIISYLPSDTLCPESTEGKDGFIHPVGISGSVENAQIELILRDFDNQALENHRRILKAIIDEVFEKFPNSRYELIFHEQYRNMKSILDNCPKLVEIGIKAMERAGLTPKLQSIRGGTDGSRLSFMGLPCPNIFAGEHAFHSKQEWVSVQDMRKAVETIVNIAVIWEEES
ncbi:MAG: peptidase [Sphingobacteriales bacterium]|nr:peptidase [Sphingobacteriales bacterium]